MKPSNKSHRLSFSLTAAVVAFLFCSCSSDVDPGLKAKKAQLENRIAKDTAYLEKTAIEIAEITARMYMHNPGGDDVSNLAFDTRNVVHTTQDLQAANQELTGVNQEINRQEMIAPNLLVDTMNVKKFDTSDPNVFSHNLRAGLPAPQPAAPPVCPNPMPGNCFVAGTPVRTPTGVRAIEDIHVGDRVLSFNGRTGNIEPARVTKLIVGHRADLMVLGTRHGAITCTQDHRFFTARGQRTEARVLSSSNRLLALGTDSTELLPVKCTARHKDLNAPVAVYNLEVEGNHDYFVGPDAILCSSDR